MRTSDFYYDLPQELIAQSPAPNRSDSRLLVYDRALRSVSDRVFSDITEYFNAGDVLVRNVTRVIPARIFGVNDSTGGRMEFLLLKDVGNKEWEALARPAKRAHIGTRFTVSPELSAVVIAEGGEGIRRIRLEFDGVLNEILDRVGEMPLPPYITERTAPKDRYQTVYAKLDGSAAAPTAGFHFTDELFSALEAKGVAIVDVLLHVGLGTFRPVAEENIEEHRMHSEFYSVSEEAAERINGARRAGGRVFAVGTTSCRTLESVADDEGVVHAGSGMTDIYITPGYRFKAVDCLITNFHLPESTLIMLVSALCSREEILDVYAHAVRERYRFFSFGDACLIL